MISVNLWYTGKHLTEHALVQTSVLNWIFSVVLSDTNNPTLPDTVMLIDCVTLHRYRLPRAGHSAYGCAPP